MKFGGSPSQKLDCSKVRFNVIENLCREIFLISGDLSILLRHEPKRSLGILPCFLPEAGQTFSREPPRVSNVRYKRLQNPQTHFPVVFALLIYPPRDRLTILLRHESQR